MLFRSHAWRSDADGDLFDGEHSGYAKLPEPMCHRRQVYLARSGQGLVVRDLLLGSGRHRFALWLHLASGSAVDVSEETRAAVELHGDAAAEPLRVCGPFGVDEPSRWWLLQIKRAEGDVVAIRLGGPKDAAVSVERGWVAPSYGVRMEAPVVTLRWEAAAPTSVTTVVS